MQKQNFLQYYRLGGNGKEYEIEKIYSRINRVLTELFTDPLINEFFHPLLHHSRMVSLMQFEDIEKAHEEFLFSLPRNIVNSVHFLYDKEHMLNGSKFLEHFYHSVPYFKKWNIHSIVVHPAKGNCAEENFNDSICENLCEDRFIRELYDSNFTIAIENMSSFDDYYGRLSNLIELRKELCMRYVEMGFSELCEKIMFCFDTGHLLKYLFEQGRSADNVLGEIKNFAQNIKVFHICTNTGHKDDHIGLKKKRRPIPSDKLYINKIDPMQEIIISNTYHILKWLKICYDNRNPRANLEFMLEQNDFFDPEILQEIGKWIIHDVFSEKKC